MNTHTLHNIFTFYIALDITDCISATCLCNSDTWSLDISNTTGVTFVEFDDWKQWVQIIVNVMC